MSSGLPRTLRLMLYETWRRTDHLEQPSCDYQMDNRASQRTGVFNHDMMNGGAIATQHYQDELLVPLCLPGGLGSVMFTVPCLACVPPSGMS